MIKTKCAHKAKSASCKNYLDDFDSWFAENIPDFERIQTLFRAKNPPNQVEN